MLYTDIFLYSPKTKLFNLLQTFLSVTESINNRNDWIKLNNVLYFFPCL